MMIVETNNLTKRYGRTTVVDQVSLQIPQGKIYGFLGLNGAGKTTTMRMLLGMTKATALEYAQDNIRVNAVCPAVIETPMADRAFDTVEKRNSAIAMHPVGRLGTVKEVVDAICWLASDEASFITGTALAVDGGANL